MGEDIGIISPYAGQISCIANELRHDPKRQREAWETLGPTRGGEVDEVEIHTVDGFEGREKQVIVFSTTRSNIGDAIGFLDDWRRMNVGLTRAKSVSVMESAIREQHSRNYSGSGLDHRREPPYTGERAPQY